MKKELTPSLPVFDRTIGRFRSDFRKQTRLDLRLSLEKREDARPEADGCSVLEGILHGTVINILTEEINFYYAPGEIYSGVLLHVVYPADNGESYLLEETGGEAHMENPFHRRWEGMPIAAGDSVEIQWPFYMDYETLKIADCSWRIAPPAYNCRRAFQIGCLQRFRRREQRWSWLSRITAF